MTFTVSYRRERNDIQNVSYEGKPLVRYVLDFTDAGKDITRLTVYQCGLETREEELNALLTTTAIDTGILFGVHRSKVKCEHGDGGIVVTVEE